MIRPLPATIAVVAMMVARLWKYRSVERNTTEAAMKQSLHYLHALRDVHRLC